MKKFLLILLLLVGAVFDGSAKYKYPKGAITATERRVNRTMQRYDVGKKGYLTLEDYENYRKSRTVEERRQEHWAIKKGTYVSPQDAFSAMDADGDGQVTREEILEYERKSIKAK